MIPNKRCNVFKIVFLSLVFFLLCSSLTACFDATEIDEWAYVHTVGIDQGITHPYRFTFQIRSMSKEDVKSSVETRAKDSQSGGNKNYYTVSVDAPNLQSGISMLYTNTPRKINLMHTKYIVISEDLAKEGLELLINSMTRSRQLRRIAYILIAKGKASDFCERINLSLTTAIAKMQEGYMITSRESGLYINTQYRHFMRDLKSTYRMPVAPIVSIVPQNISDKSSNSISRSDGDYAPGELPISSPMNIEFLGTALFDGDKMAGEFNGNETRAMLMVRGDFEKGSITIADPLAPNTSITFEVTLAKKPAIHLAFKQGHPVIHVQLFLEGDLESVQTHIDYEQSDLKKFLENQFEAYMKQVMDQTIHKAQKLNADVFSFGEKAAMHFLTIKEWEDYNWLGEFENAKFTTSVQFVIRRTGTLLKLNPVKNSEGDKE